MAYGGREGITSLHLIESAISRAYSGYHKSLDRKAAATLESVVNNHGFTDGNKRTAWLLVEILIDRSGYYLDIPDEYPIDDIVVAVAGGEMDFAGLREWFATHLQRV